jgi:hypothetical protein
VTGELLKYENKIKTVFTLIKVGGSVQIFTQQPMLIAGHH